MIEKPASVYILRLQPAYIRQNGVVLLILVLMLNGMAYAASPLRGTSQEAGLWGLMSAMTLAVILVGISVVVIETRNLRELRFQKRTICILRLVGPQQPFLATELAGMERTRRAPTYRSTASVADHIVLKFTGGERFTIIEVAAAAFGVSLAQIEVDLQRLYPQLRLPNAPGALQEHSHHALARDFKLQGDRHLKSGCTQDAVEAYENAILHHPDYEALKMEIGEIHFSEARFDQAARAFRAIVTIFPRQASAWRRLGQSLLAMGHTLEAQESLEKALEITQDDAEAHYSLALIHAQRGDNVIARHALHEAFRRQEELRLAARRDPRLADLIEDHNQ